MVGLKMEGGEGGGEGKGDFGYAWSTHVLPSLSLARIVYACHAGYERGFHFCYLNFHVLNLILFFHALTIDKDSFLP